MNNIVIVKMEQDSITILNEILERESIVTIPQDDSMYSRMRTLLISLLGMSVSLCSFNTQEDSLLDEEEDQDMNSISFGRKITKPFIRFALGPTMLSTLVTAACSLLLMLSVMSTEMRWHQGARWLAAPALLAVAVEVCSDTADAALSVALLSSTAPGRALLYGGAAVVLIVAEFMIWYYIAKFFEHQPRSEVQDPSNKQIPNFTHTSLKTDTVI